MFEEHLRRRRVLISLPAIKFMVKKVDSALWTETVRFANRPFDLFRQPAAAVGRAWEDKYDSIAFLFHVRCPAFKDKAVAAVGGGNAGLKRW